MKAKLWLLPLALMAAGLPAAAQQNTEAHLRTLLQAKTGIVTLPEGVIEVSREILMAGDVHDLEIRGAKTTIKASAAFRGRGLIIFSAGKNIKIHDVLLDGNRDAFPQPVTPPPSAAMLSRVIANNGLMFEGVTGLEITQLKATQFAGFPIIINGGRKVHIQDIELTESGTLDASGHNNGTGGLALEEGVAEFDIVHALIGKVRGNGIWIRSVGNATAEQGRITGSEFAIVARAAIEMNHASGITIENNSAHMVGFPGEEVLTGGTALPAAITTTGAVNHAAIRDNDFEQIAGRCLSLDGFSDSEVTGNVCMAELFNGIMMRGANNKITGNRLTDLNNAKRDQPESLRAGVYLATGAMGNTVESNEIAGYGMAQHCVGGPGTGANKVSKNSCSDGTSVARLLPAKPR